MKSKELASLALDAVVQRKAVESLKEVMLTQERKGMISNLQSAALKLRDTVYEKDRTLTGIPVLLIF